MLNPSAGGAALAFRAGSGAPSKATHMVGSVALPIALLALFSLVTVVLFWQWIPHLRSALIGPPEDNMQDFWNVWYAAASPRSSFFFTDLIRYPEGTPLYYHSFAYPKLIAISAFIGVLGWSDVGLLVLLHNLSLLASFPLAATAAFYLVRHISGSSVGAVLGGFVFAFNPSHVQHAMHHVGVSSIEFIPLFALLYLLAIERKSLLLVVGAAGLCALSALSCWYYVFYLAYFMLFHMAYLAVRDRTLPTGWPLAASAAILGCVAAVLAPILIPMVGMAMRGATIYEPGSDFYVADVLAYLAFPSYHVLGPLAEGIYARVTGNEWEATVYLGLANVAILAWLYLWSRKRGSSAFRAGRASPHLPQLVPYVLTGMAVFGILAAGDTLHVFGHSTIPLPGAVLSQLPFFSNVRAPSRAIVLVYMFLAIGVGHAIGLLLKHQAGGPGRMLVGAVAGLVVLDFSPVRTLPMTPIACPPGLAIIRDDAAKGFAVLDLPGGWYDEGNFYMLQQAACHGRPILQGSTSRSVVNSLRDRLETSDLRAQKSQLAAAKVKYIIVHSRRDVTGLSFRWRPQYGPRQQYFSIYPVVYSDPGLAILRVY